MVLLQFYAIIIINFIKADIMKDNKNKNKKDNTFLYFIIGLVALFVWVEYDKQQAERQAQRDSEMAVWYYYNFMQ